MCSNITKTTQDMLVISKAVTKGVVSLEGDSLKSKNAKLLMISCVRDTVLTPEDDVEHGGFN